jgi:DNA-binding response OmpR family regulator
MAVVLVIEDSPDLRRVLEILIAKAGHTTIAARDGREGLRAFHEHRPDLVVLDVGLPQIDGWTVLERIRDIAETPVMMLTAHGFERDKVRGLNAGADDYVTKPFGNDELVARVNALVRRAKEDPRDEAYDDGRLRVDAAARTVRIDGSDVALSPLEFRLLATLVRHRNQTLSNKQLLEQAWRDPLSIGPDRVKYTVMRLRRKLEEHGLDAGRVETVRGFGYRFSG